MDLSNSAACLKNMQVLETHTCHSIQLCLATACCTIQGRRTERGSRIYIYIYIYIYVELYIHIYIYIHRRCIHMYIYIYIIVMHPYIFAFILVNQALRSPYTVRRSACDGYPGLPWCRTFIDRLGCSRVVGICHCTNLCFRASDTFLVIHMLTSLLKVLSV